VGLEYLQRRRLHNFPGQPVPGLCHSQREEVLPHVLINRLCPEPSHTRSVSIANARCSSSLAGEGGRPGRCPTPCALPHPPLGSAPGWCPARLRLHAPDHQARRSSQGAGGGTLSTCVLAAPLCREKRCQLIPAGTTLPRRCLQASQASQGHTLVPTHRRGPAPMVLKDTLHVLVLHAMEMSGVGSALPRAMLGPPRP